ncbi:hypothetical protein K440DRAFT_640149 [Wilcoxina mikolae CBS 423.85]|nr:hypothetical protein K440DRAFT_640149 [Wilcoxina mikolae CBS 423.85]
MLPALVINLTSSFNPQFTAAASYRPGHSAPSVCLEITLSPGLYNYSLNPTSTSRGPRLDSAGPSGPVKGQQLTDEEKHDSMELPSEVHGFSCKIYEYLHADRGRPAVKAASEHRLRLPQRIEKVPTELSVNDSTAFQRLEVTSLAFPGPSPPQLIQIPMLRGTKNRMTLAVKGGTTMLNTASRFFEKELPKTRSSLAGGDTFGA